MLCGPAYGEDGIYFDHRADYRDSVHRTCAGRWRSVVSLGFCTDGREGRPSQSLAPEQASALFEAAEKSRLHALSSCAC